LPDGGAGFSLSEAEASGGGGCLNFGFGLLAFGFGFGVGGWPLFRPLPGPTHFLCLAKESKQRKRARDGERLLEFMLQGGEGKNSLRSDRPPLFFLPATEIQGAI
jgi:hypothetical protein